MERDPALRSLVADSLSKKGEALADLNDVNGATAAYDELARRHERDNDPAYRLRALRALYDNCLLYTSPSPRDRG